MEKNEPDTGQEILDTPALAEGRDYYWENGLMVLTGEYLRRRGYCCGNGCRHCPFSEMASD